MATIDSNAFLSSATSHAYVSPILFSNLIEKQVYEEEKLRPLGVTDTRALNKAGRQINIPKGNAYTVSALTDGTVTPVSALSYDQVTVTFTEYGDAKMVSMKELMEAFDSTMQDMVYSAGKALAYSRDSVIMTALVAGATATIYPAGVVSTTITAGNTFDTDLIADAITAGRLLNFPVKYLIIHPNCEKSLMKLSAFIDASQYGGREATLNGEIGKYLGVKILSSLHVPTASENSQTTYKNIALGERAFVFAPKMSPKLEWEREVNRNRAVTFHYWEVYGVSVLNAEAIHDVRAVGG